VYGSMLAASVPPTTYSLVRQQSWKSNGSLAVLADGKATTCLPDMVGRQQQLYHWLALVLSGYAILAPWTCNGLMALEYTVAIPGPACRTTFHQRKAFYLRKLGR